MKVSPTSADITAKVGSTTLQVGSTNTLSAGSTISLSKTFEPKNASNTELNVEVSDNSVLEVQNNNTNSPTINVLKDGSATFSVTMISLGETSKVTYSLQITPRPKIDFKDMDEFNQLVRKSIGHFSLFLVDAIFGFSFASSYEVDENIIRIRTDKSDLLFEIKDNQTLIGEGFARGTFRKSN